MNVQTNITFRDFYSFNQLEQEPEILNSLIRCYQNIFSEPEIWDEHYSQREIEEKLTTELSGTCAIRLCIDRKQKKVIGFCWAQSLTTEKISDCIEGIKYNERKLLDDVKEYLSILLADKTAVYLHDLGIDKNYRQSISLAALILPPVTYVAQQSGDERLVFWSVAETCIAHIADKAGITPFHEKENLLFFSGELTHLLSNEIAY